MHPVLEALSRIRLLPLVTLPDPARAGEVAAALAEGGLPCIEVAFRAAGAAEAVRRAAEVPGMLVAAGTVLTTEQAEAAVGAGARLIVSPALHPRVVGWCIERKIPVLPGVCTPGDIAAALDFGLETVKFFPAESYGGAKTIRSLAAPYPMVRFVPTGGIDEKNLADYLKIPAVLACGGSWMAKPEWIAAGARQEIVRAAAAAVAAVAGAKQAK